MAKVHVSAIGAIIGSTASTIVPTLPKGLRAGDVMLLWHVCRPTGTAGSNDAVGTPSGWSLEYTTARAELGTADEIGRLYSRRVTSPNSETDPSLSQGTAIQGTGAGAQAVIIALRGVDAATLLDVTPTESAPASSTTAAAPAITTATNGALVLSFVGTADDNALSLGANAQSFALLTTGLYATGVDQAVGIAAKEITTAGAVTMPQAWTQTSNGADAWIALSVAIRPAAQAWEYEENWVAPDAAAWDGEWTTNFRTGGGATSSVAAAGGRHNIPAVGSYGAFQHARLDAPGSLGDIELEVDYVFAYAGEHYPTVMIRDSAGNNQNGYTIGFGNGAGSNVYTQTTSGGGGSDIGSVAWSSLGGAPVVGDVAHARIKMVGGLLQVRVWKNNAAEPGTWNIYDGTPTALGGTGTITLGIYGGSSATAFTGTFRALRINPSSSTAYDEPLTVTVTSTTTGGDVAGRVEALALTATSSTTGTDARHLREGKSLLLDGAGDVVLDGNGAPILVADPLVVSITATVTGADTLTGGSTAYDEALQVTVTSTTTAADRGGRTEALEVEAVFTVTGGDNRAAVETSAVDVASATATGDAQAMAEVLAATVTATVTGADSLSLTAEQLQVTTTATVTGGDTLHAADALAVEAVTSTTGGDVAGRVEPLEVTVTSSTTGDDVHTLAEALVVEAVSTVTATDVAAFSDALLVPVTATVSGDDVLTSATAEELQVVATSTVTGGDRLTASDALSVAITSATVGGGTWSATESLLVTVTSTTTSGDERAAVEALAVVVTATVTGADSLSGGANAYTEQLLVTVTATVDSADVRAGSEPLLVEVVATTAAGDSAGLVEPGLVLVTSSTAGGDSLGAVEPLALTVTSTTVGGDVRAAVESLVALLVATVTGVDRASTDTGIDPTRRTIVTLSSQVVSTRPVFGRASTTLELTA